MIATAAEARHSCHVDQGATFHSCHFDRSAAKWRNLAALRAYAAISEGWFQGFRLHRAGCEPSERVSAKRDFSVPIFGL
jgi:hypothetical protein